MTARVLILPGDGIGPEIVAEAVKVIECLRRDFDLDVALEEALVGGAAYEAVGRPLPEEKRSRRHARPMPSCSAPSAARNTKASRAHCDRSGPYLVCVRRWACSLTCARRCPTHSSRAPQRSSRRSWPGSTS